MSNEIVNDFERPSVLSPGLTPLCELIREITSRRVIDFSRVIYTDCSSCYDEFRHIDVRKY